MSSESRVILRLPLYHSGRNRPTRPSLTLSPRCGSRQRYIRNALALSGLGGTSVARVILRGLDRSSTSHIPQIFFGGAPLLSSLQLSGIGRACLPPLSGVTKMSLYDIHLAGLWTYQYFRAVLSATPLLAELSIQGLVIDHWSADSYERVQLPSLRSLRLCGQETYVSYILFSLSMPHIEHLSLNAFLCFPDTPTYPTISSLVFIRSIPLSRF